MPNFSSLARLEVPEKFVWWVVVGGVCKVIFMSNPTVVLRLGWGFDNMFLFNVEHIFSGIRGPRCLHLKKGVLFVGHPVAT